MGHQVKEFSQKVTDPNISVLLNPTLQSTPGDGKPSMDMRQLPFFLPQNILPMLYMQH